ncbi:MAG: hypothetical protein HKO62_13115 [Gammaproteobacteria bacterium]|nr:hypothetical protein [Gammaproteobacteria bacterium]NNM01686.1 hypothetical protein [Gammaproteobacteria bacterium]
MRTDRLSDAACASGNSPAGHLRRRVRRGLAATLACIALGTAPLPASATLLQGAIGFGGLFNPTGGTDLSDATGISIGFSIVTAATGDFVPAIGNNVTWSPLTFNPANTPLASLWQVTAGLVTYSFDLLNVTVDSQDAAALFLSGSGSLLATGFDPTPGAWSFSGQSGNVFFTFSSISGVVTDADLAEPGTLLILFLTILVGLPVLRRRRAAPVAAALALAAAMPMTASASVPLPIDENSELAMFGTAAPTGGTDFASATGLTFASPVIIAAGVNDFAFAVGGNATYSDFDFASPVLGTIMTFSGGGSFTASAVTVDLQTPTALGLTLDGVWALTGFDFTPGTLTLTADNLFGLTAFSSSGVITAAPTATSTTGVPFASIASVPIPGALVLFGPALVALEARRRRRR